MTRLRIRGGTVLTIDASGTLLDRGEVLVDDSRIVSVGPRHSRPPGEQPESRGEEIIDAPDGLILPGLVNAHTHSPDMLVRGTAPALPLEAWSLFNEAGRVGRTPREIYLSALLCAAEALRTGTTTILDHLRLSPRLHLEGLEAAAQAYTEAGIRAVIAPVLADLPLNDTLPLDLINLPPAISEPLHQPPPPAEEQVEVWEAFFQRWQSRIGVQLGPSAPHRCSDVLLGRCAELAERHGVRVHTHFLETAAQALAARRRFPRGAAAHLAALQLLPRASLVHCVFAEEVETITESGACVVHCPVANLRLGSGMMNWNRFAGMGARLALGTDGVLCNDSMSMLAVMKVAGLLHGQNHWGGSQAILRAAIQGGAAACGRGDIGSLEPGRRADLIVLTPAFSADAYSQIAYAGEALMVRAVVVDGRVVVRDGRVTTIDEGAALAEARERVQGLVRRNAARYRFAREAAPYMEALVRRAEEVYAQA